MMKSIDSFDENEMEYAEWSYVIYEGYGCLPQFISKSGKLYWLDVYIKREKGIKRIFRAEGITPSQRQEYVDVITEKCGKQPVADLHCCSKIPLKISEDATKDKWIILNVLVMIVALPAAVIFSLAFHFMLFFFILPAAVLFSWITRLIMQRKFRAYLAADGIHISDRKRKKDILIDAGQMSWVSTGDR